MSMLVKKVGVKRLTYDLNRGYYKSTRAFYLKRAGRPDPLLQLSSEPQHLLDARSVFHWNVSETATVKNSLLLGPIPTREEPQHLLDARQKALTALGREQLRLGDNFSRYDLNPELLQLALSVFHWNVSETATVKNSLLLGPIPTREEPQHLLDARQKALTALGREQLRLGDNFSRYDLNPEIVRELGRITGDAQSSGFLDFGRMVFSLGAR